MTKVTRRKRYADSASPWSWKGSPTGQCTYCTIRPATQWDHIIPRSREGSDMDSNLAAVCELCNGSKRNKTLTEWLEFLTPYSFLDDCTNTCGCCRFVEETGQAKEWLSPSSIVARATVLYDLEAAAQAGEGT